MNPSPQAPRSSSWWILGITFGLGFAATVLVAESESLRSPFALAWETVARVL